MANVGLPNGVETLLTISPGCVDARALQTDDGRATAYSERSLKRKPHQQAKRARPGRNLQVNRIDVKKDRKEDQWIVDRGEPISTSSIFPMSASLVELKDL